ncbi:MAG: bacterioferritin [Pacificimonas sp.]
MKGNADVIACLNEALKNELTATNQYWLHYRLLDHWGIYQLAAYERAESIDEMKHADQLAARILMLDGLPNFQMVGRLRVGESVKEVLESDMALEIEAVAQLKAAIKICDDTQDYVSRELFTSILASEEHHVDYIEQQLEQMGRMGEQNYIQLHSGTKTAE